MILHLRKKLRLDNYCMIIVLETQKNFSQIPKNNCSLHNCTFIEIKVVSTLNFFFFLENQPVFRYTRRFDRFRRCKIKLFKEFEQLK